jgi:hypothetical protein
MGPIKRRKKDKISVHYNTRKVGPFHKTISVYSNAVNGLVKLEIKGKVLPEEAKANTPPVKKKSLLNTNKS